MKYYIYLLKCGSARYVGSTNNFTRRYRQHYKDLKQGNHVNDVLLKEFKKGHRLEHKILKTGHTLFNKQILIDEQRMINRYSNSNESIASKQFKYTKKEFCMDIIDWIVNHWKMISAIILAILVFGYGMTNEQASKVIDVIVSLYATLGGK